MSEGSQGPQFEAPAPPVQNQEDLNLGRPEEAPAHQESGVGKAAPVASTGALPAIPVIPTIPQQIPVDFTQQQTPAAQHDDFVADDSDHIEKQWVDKAKKIIAQTRDDPHKQKSEMSKVKAAYIKKRFNKVIKTEEPAANPPALPGAGGTTVKT